MFPQFTHILVDAARIGDELATAQARNKEFGSLYRVDNEDPLPSVAPYLFRFIYGQPFATWFLKTGWGDSWGVALKCSYPFAELHKHFRKFLIVQTESKRNLYFRFYDPRVLRIFLPTCEPAQLREFFGPVSFFLVEDEDPAYAIRYWHENGILKQDRFAVADAIDALPAPDPLSEQGPKPLPPETIAALEAQGHSMSPKGSESLPPETIAELKKLPPETIAALKEAGIDLDQPAQEEVQTTPAAQSSAPVAPGTAKAPPAKPQSAPAPKPTPPPPVGKAPVMPNKPAPATSQPKPATPSAPEAPVTANPAAKPKTKWNTFD